MMSDRLFTLGRCTSVSTPPCWASGCFAREELPDQASAKNPGIKALGVTNMYRFVFWFSARVFSLFQAPSEGVGVSGEVSLQSEIARRRALESQTNP